MRVCCNMISATHTRYASRLARQGSSRRCARNQPKQLLLKFRKRPRRELWRSTHAGERILARKCGFEVPYRASMNRMYDEDHSAVGIVFCGRHVRMILKISRSAARAHQETRRLRPTFSARMSRQRAQRVVDDFARGRHRRRRTGPCEIESPNRFRGSATRSTRPSDTARSNRSACSASAICAQYPRAAAQQTVEHQHHAPLVLARKFAHHQLSRSSRWFSSRRIARCRVGRYSRSECSSWPRPRK